MPRRCSRSSFGSIQPVIQLEYGKHKCRCPDSRDCGCCTGSNAPVCVTGDAYVAMEKHVDVIVICHRINRRLRSGCENSTGMKDLKVALALASAYCIARVEAITGAAFVGTETDLPLFTAANNRSHRNEVRHSNRKLTKYLI